MMTCCTRVPSVLSKISTACCPYPAFSQALMAVFYVMMSQRVVMTVVMKLIVVVMVVVVNEVCQKLGGSNKRYVGDFLKGLYGRAILWQW